MKVSEFVEGFKNLQKPDLQKNFVEQHIRRKYVPIGEKNAILHQFVEDCVLVDKNGIPYINMVANKINFIYAIVILYTDLELDKLPDTTNEDGSIKKGKSDIIGSYDKMQEFGVIDAVCDLIGERELSELTFVNKEVLDTWYNAHASTRAYLATLADKSVRTFVELSELLGREKINLNPDNIMKFMGIPEEQK